MTTGLFYGLVGVLLFSLGVHGFFRQAHLLRKILALNFMSSGVFLALVGLAQREHGPDPVPHALVLTGIVVAVCGTALALVLLRQYFDATGSTRLDEDRDA